MNKYKFIAVTTTKKRSNKNDNKPIIKKGYGIIRPNANIPYGYFSKYGNNKAVYGIKCIDTNKQYIGATNHIQRRLLKHFNELFHNRHKNKLLQKDFNLYGLKSFDIIIYDNNEDTILLDKEKEIQISIGIDNLYNEKISGVYITEEYRNKLASSSKDSHKTNEYREKMRKIKSNKIAQYNIDYTLIKIWDSSKEICDILYYTRSVILSCCNKSKKTAYGYIWRYVDDDGNILENGYKNKNKIKI